VLAPVVLFLAVLSRNTLCPFWFLLSRNTLCPSSLLHLSLTCFVKANWAFYLRRRSSYHVGRLDYINRLWYHVIKRRFKLFITVIYYHNSVHSCSRFAQRWRFDKARCCADMDTNSFPHSLPGFPHSLPGNRTTCSSSWKESLEALLGF